MSMGLLGALGGLGQGLSQSGTLMAKSALEEARAQRLEEAKMRAEERANREHDRRQQSALSLKYGEGADFSGGTVALDHAAQRDNAEQMIDINARQAGANAQAKLPAQQALAQFQADLKATEAGQKPSSSMVKYLELRQMGESHEAAMATAYSTERVISDPVVGGSQVVRKGDNEVVAGTEVVRDADGRATGLEFRRRGDEGPGLLSGGAEEIPAPVQDPVPGGNPPVGQLDPSEIREGRVIQHRETGQFFRIVRNEQGELVPVPLEGN